MTSLKASLLLIITVTTILNLGFNLYKLGWRASSQDKHLRSIRPQKLITHFIESQSFDINIRILDEGLHDIRECFSCAEYDQGVIFEDDKLKVEALRVQHPPIDDCFALKFETASVKIVFGADTTYFPPLAEFAKDADILVHEAMHLGAAQKFAFYCKRQNLNYGRIFRPAIPLVKMLAGLRQPRIAKPLLLIILYRRLVLT